MRRRKLAPLALFAFLALAACARGAESLSDYVLTDSPELARECDAIVRRLEARYGKPKVWRAFPVRLTPCPTSRVAGYTRYLKPNVLEVAIFQTLEQARGTTLDHELTHAFFFYYLDNNFDLMLNEGLAQNSEDARRERLRADVCERARSDALKPLDRLYGADRYDPESALYVQGFSVVDMLIGRGGSRWFAAFIDELTNASDGRGIDEALERFYGYRSLKEFEEDWLDYVANGQDRSATRAVGRKEKR